MSETAKTIEGFEGWDQPTQQHDFFGETNLTADVVETVTKDDIVNTDIDPEKAKEKPAPSEEEKLKAQTDEQFKSFEPTATPAADEEEEAPELNEDGTPKEKTEKKVAATKVSSKSTLEFLKEKGLVDYQLGEGEELTDELADAKLEDFLESSIDAGVEETIKELPQEIKDLIKFASKGGNPMDLLAKMANQVKSGITKDSDINEESVQILALSQDLRDQGYDQETIDTQIDFLKESGKLAAMGKKAFEKITAKQEADIAEEVQKVADQKEARKKQARDYKVKITSHINGLTEVGGMPISKKDKESLPSYISEPTVELQDGRVISELQAGLFKVMADENKIVLLAKLIKSDFDFSAITRAEQTTVSRGVKENLERTEKKNIQTTATTQTGKKKALWEMLED